VEVAKAIASEPRLLILDEATSRLGETHVDRLFKVVRRLREERDTSTILITHRLREMVELADRAVVLRDGRVVGHLPRDAITEVSLSVTMVGRQLGDLFNKRSVNPGSTVLELEDVRLEGAKAPTSFGVRAGEIVGLAGLVGSGRTEILESVAGVRGIEGGRIIVNGKPLRPGNAARALSAGVALLPEDRHLQGLDLQASIRRNIGMPTWNWLSANAKAETRLAQDAITQLRIKAQGPKVPVRNLSGGNQQKVVLARCLVTSPSVLLLDEPTRGVDVGAKAEIYRLMGDMVERGMGVLLVTSDMTELLGLADRIVVLHERDVVAELTRESATEERIAYLSAGGKD
jgi:ABC-type sugar transport system ATPase subunit